MAWAVGQRLQGSKYTIEQELGEGGFGITYRARDNQGRIVVIKTLNDTVQRRPDFAKFQQDFLNEALRLARCSHPHIVRINEVIQEGQLWCIVMEYIDGEDLASRVENQGALPSAEALRYIQQIGEALTVVHHNGLLHRDIKPQNIMLRGKSEAVLIDFGIAREFTPNLTQTHTQFLSNGFAPIEQYDKRAKRGAYTDVYALAATLYSLSTGEVPTIAPLRAIGTLLEPPKQINPTISDRINQAILRGMEIKPEDRPQSIQEWLKLLQTNNNACAASPQMLGTWYGKFGSCKATLVITKQSGDLFDGTLIPEHWWNGTAKVVINGSLNRKINAVIIREISIISGYWRLGENQGTLSSDGKQISGKGKDRSNSYSWSFVRVD
jgi:serine/threonine protein kinase